MNAVDLGELPDDAGRRAELATLLARCAWCFKEMTMPDEERPRAGFQDFTDRSRKVLELARRAAKEMGDAHVGTEHLLVGLCREGDGVAAHVLKNFGVLPERIVVAVHDMLGATTQPASPTAEVRDGQAQ